jgi:hypothetical protein
MIQESNLDLKLHYCCEPKYIASLINTSKKSMIEKYKIMAMPVGHYSPVSNAGLE